MKVSPAIAQQYPSQHQRGQIADVVKDAHELHQPIAGQLPHESKTPENDHQETELQYPAAQDPIDHLPRRGLIMHSPGNNGQFTVPGVAKSHDETRQR